MTTITIPKREYQKLIDTRLRYEYLREIFEKGFFATPPTHDKKAIVRAFRDTKKYSKQFLESLEKGLGRSSYFRA